MSFLSKIFGNKDTKSLKIANSYLTKINSLEEEFSKLSELDSKIAIITGTDNIVGSLAISSENVLTQYLKENC